MDSVHQRSGDLRRKQTDSQLKPAEDGAILIPARPRGGTRARSNTISRPQPQTFSEYKPTASTSARETFEHTELQVHIELPSTSLRLPQLDTTTVISKLLEGPFVKTKLPEIEAARPRFPSCPPQATSSQTNDFSPTHRNLRPLSCVASLPKHPKPGPLHTRYSPRILTLDHAYLPPSLPTSTYYAPFYCPTCKTNFNREGAPDSPKSLMYKCQYSVYYLPEQLQLICSTSRCKSCHDKAEVAAMKDVREKWERDDGSDGSETMDGTNESEDAAWNFYTRCRWEKDTEQGVGYYG